MCTGWMSANVNGRVATDWVPGAGATATGIAHTEQCINTFAFPFSGRKEPHFAAFLWIFSGFLSTVSVGLKMHDYDYVGSGHFRTEMYIFNSRTINILLFSFVFRHMIFDWLSGIFGEFGVGKPPCSTCAMLSFGEREREYFGRVETNQPAVCVFLLLPRRWRNVLKSYQFVALKFGPSSLTSLSLSLVLSNSHLFGSGPDISHPLYLYLVHELRLVFVWECCGACSSVRIFYGLVLGNFPREILISVFFAPFDSNMCCAYVVDFFSVFLFFRFFLSRYFVSLWTKLCVFLLYFVGAKKETK